MPTFELKNFLPYKLSILSQSVSGLIAKEYSNQFDLTINQWRCIVIINAHSSVTAKGICEHSLLDKMTVSRALNSLSQRHYIRLSPAPHDGRKQILKLTQFGRKIYKKILPLAQDYEASLLGVLSNGEIKTLDIIMKKLMTAANVLQIEKLSK